MLTGRQTFPESADGYSLCVDCTEVATGRFAITASVTGPKCSEFIKNFDKPEDYFFSVPTKIATVLRLRNPDLYRELTAKKLLEDNATEAHFTSVPLFPMHVDE